MCINHLINIYYHIKINGPISHHTLKSLVAFTSGSLNSLELNFLTSYQKVKYTKQPGETHLYSTRACHKLFTCKTCLENPYSWQTNSLLMEGLGFYYRSKTLLHRDMWRAPTHVLASDPIICQDTSSYSTHVSEWSIRLPGYFVVFNTC